MSLDPTDSEKDPDAPPTSSDPSGERLLRELLNYLFVLPATLRRRRGTN
jgi:hypothetical protein